MWKLEVPLNQKKHETKTTQPTAVTSQVSGCLNPEWNAGAPLKFQGLQEPVVCVHNNCTGSRWSPVLLRQLTQLRQRPPFLFLASNHSDTAFIRHQLFVKFCARSSHCLGAACGQLEIFQRPSYRKAPSFLSYYVKELQIVCATNNN